MRALSTLLFAALLLPAHAQLRQTIDEELLSELISNKQEAIKARVLGNLISKNIHTTNYTTYNTLYNVVDIILTEKNTTVMTDGILHQVTDYAITYALTDRFLRTAAQAGKLPALLSIPEANQGYDACMTKLLPKPKKPNVNWTAFAAVDPVMLDDDAKAIGATALNWLTDTMWGTLATSKLAKNGFFEVDQRHPRIRAGLNHVDYEDFETNNAALTTKLAAEVDAYVKTIADLVIEVQTAATALATPGAAGFAGLKLSDLSALTKAQVEAVFALWTRAVELFRNTIYQNAIVAKIADIVARYVITDMQEVDPAKYRFAFSIDVEGIILDMEDEFTNIKLSSLRNSWIGVKPFFSIGLNYGYFGKFDNSFESTTQYGIESIGWAGEKIGLKFLLWDFGYTHSFRPGQWFKYRNSYRKWPNPPSKPLLYNIYLFTYASGLIYTIADLRTDATFKHAILGAGGGFEFFNGMDLNLSYAVPMVPNTSFDQKLDNAFYNVGFDIPIFEYLKAKKKGTK